MTELATEMPRCFSISIQSDVAWREALRAFTLPAMCIAPAKSSSFSVSVVLPATGWEMIAKVRRRAASRAIGDTGFMKGPQKLVILRGLACDSRPARAPGPGAGHGQR